MELYKSFVRKNGELLGQVESIAQGLTWLLPERLAGSDLGLEAVSSALGLVGVLNDAIRAEAAHHTPLHQHHQPRISTAHQPAVLRNHDRVLGIASEAAATARWAGSEANGHRLAGAPSSACGNAAPPPTCGNAAPPPTKGGPPPPTPAIPSWVEGGPESPYELLLLVVQQLEVLAEMAADKAYGPDGKWGVVAAVEALKAALRLRLLAGTGGRPLLDGGLVRNPHRMPPGQKAGSSAAAFARFRRIRGIADPRCPPEAPPIAGATSLAPPSAAATVLAAAQAVAAARAALKLAPRVMDDGESPTLPPAESPVISRPSPPCPLIDRRRPWIEVIQSQLAGEQWLVDGHNHSNALDESESPLARQSRAWLAAAEVMRITRPPLYVLALRGWGRRSWWPWIMSLSLEGGEAALQARAGVVAMRAVAAGEPAGGAAGLDAAERGDIQRRRLMLVCYLLRSPAFEALAKRPLDALGTAADAVPLLGPAVRWAGELLLGAQGYYFYTAT